MNVPPRVTYSGDTFAGKRFRKEALVQLGILREQMRWLIRKVGSRRVPPYPGVLIEARIAGNQEGVNVHVDTGYAGIGKRAPLVDEILDWYWYALCVSIEPDPDPVTGAPVFISGGGGLSDVDVDALGNVYVVGYSRTMDFTDVNAELSNEAVSIKYDRDGKFVRRRVLVGGALSGVNKNESGTGIAIDPTTSGIYITADVYRYREDNCYDAGLIKYDAAGTILWKRRFSLGATGIDDLFGWGADTDPAGNVVAVGLANVYDVVEPWFLNNPYGLLYAYGWLISFQPDGTLNWARQIGDTLPDSNGHPTVYNSVFLYDVATPGDVIACGTLQEDVVGYLFPVGMVVKLNSSGVLQWHREIEGKFKRADGTYGFYAPDFGLRVRGCSVDSDGSIYCVSIARITVATNDGWFHFHVSKISAAGVLVWQRYFEVQYHSDSDAAQAGAQIDVGPSGVYVIVPMFPNSGATPAVPWGGFILKFQKTDSTDPTGPLAGDLLWQRQLTINLPQPEFTSYSGVLPYAIRVAGAELYLAAAVVSNVSPMTIKLPANIPVGNHQGLVFTASTLPIYSDPSNIPVHEDAGTGETTPGYEFVFHDTGVTLNTKASTITISTPAEVDYVSPSWTQTRKILKHSRTSSKEAS